MPNYLIIERGLIYKLKNILEVIYSIKRLVGKSYNIFSSISNLIKASKQSKHYSNVNNSAKIL